MPAFADSPLAQWTAPECPFAVEYAPQVLDDIRLAVVDAFFSLPRGGAEIGGILLGRHAGNRVTITGWQALECEHAHGPSFTLSDTDRARLGELIAAAEKNPIAMPVGWYHSHTRSEIFLSEADQEIHQSFFQEAWHVALVLKPHTFLPTRAGFFFRGKGGAMRAEASYLEFELDPLPAGPLPSRAPVSGADPLEPRDTTGRVIEVTGVVEEAPSVAESAPRPTPQTPEVPPPTFLAARPARFRYWPAILGVLLGVAAGVGAYQTRARWTPVVASRFRPASPLGQASVDLHAIDRDGQLQIFWDGNARDVRRGRGAILLINDGPRTQSIPLDAAQLQTGSLTYARQSERVDVTLSLDEPDGKRLLKAATFVGKPVPQAAPAGDAGGSKADFEKERDALAQENAQLKTRTQSLEKSLEQTRRELRKRLRNQAAGGAK